MSYTRVNWTSETPISVENLNNMDAAIKALDPVDNLTSESTTAPLSANQGKKIYEKLVGEVVYTSENGTTGNVTFTKNITGASYIDIVLVTSGKEHTQRIYNPVGATIDIGAKYWSGNLFIIAPGKATVSATGITIVNSECGYMVINADNNGIAVHKDNNNYNGIKKVVAYF